MNVGEVGMQRLRLGKPENSFGHDPLNLNPSNPQIFFEISVDKDNVGRIVMELFYDITPDSAMNFLALCMGEYGIGKVYKKPLHLKGTRMFRVVPKYMAQGGDIVNGNGTGGECIWGERFADENFMRKHIGCGIMSYANKGRHTNASQFFFSLAECPWLDGRYVVFGQVLQGFNILQTMAKEGSISGQTKKKVIISDCGAFNLSEENLALLRASLLSASQSMAWKKYEIAIPGPSDEDLKREKSIHEVLAAPVKDTTKGAPVKTPPQKKKPAPVQTEDSYDGSDKGTYIYGQLRTLQFQ